MAVAENVEDADAPVKIVRGDIPVVLGVPHAGTWVPEPVTAALNETGRGITDTDWHMDRLYDGLLPGASMVCARFHRYVIDANRDPSGASLYPGQNTTGLVPTTDFDGNPIWDTPPDDAEIAARVAAFHRPYHEALASEIERVRAQHGIVILYDCHSIRSRIPFLFDGTLPDFNIGTNRGETCAPAIEQLVERVCASAHGYTSILNGRFVGGWTTRHYGRPEQGVHAIQMELAQSTYMDEHAPWTYRPEKADAVRRVLGDLLEGIHQLHARL
ncbi:N-formylglutamate deformylase [Mesorhizobium sp. CAU 1741]|uniref:N-formylglutamate deformylase n=1 Tax=Mesorhizobium sp. CAU 1741 TaxID=3140366 RepID=UPI00325AC0DD